ncbi:uncharacterized protein [Onthophagus taurus]|uniref:uncharacterized protein isoform X2 n=1 Tax=Onthophagus taurus TaxID=166361 RepID=UPI0039BE83AA
MSKRSAFRKISEMQLYPLAFNLSKSPTSWVSIKQEDCDSLPTQNTHNKVNYVVVQNPKSLINIRSVTTYVNLQLMMWEIIVILSIIINSILVSLTYIFVKPSTIFNGYFYGILVMDIIYIFDVILGFILKYNPAILVYTIGEERNIKWILFDLSLSLPLPVATLVITREITMWYLIFRFITLIRLYKLLYFFKRIENVVCDVRWIIFSVKLIIYLIISLHFCANIWYLLSSEYSNRPSWRNTILNQTYYPKNIEKWYFISLYYSTITFFNCGFGDIFPTTASENIISSIIMFLGMFFWVYYISNVAVLKLRNKRRNFELFKKYQLVNKHLKFINASSELILKIKEYFNILINKKSGINCCESLLNIPGDLVTTTNHFASVSLLRNSVVFKTKPEQFLRHVSGMVKHEFYMPEQDIYTEQIVKEKMVIIQSGNVNILSEEDHESPVLSFGPGTCLGECALILCLTSNVTVRAASFVEIQAIYTRDFIKCSLTHPDFFMEVRNSIQKRLVKSLTVDETRSNVLKTLKGVLNEQIQCTEMIMKFLALYNIQKVKQRKFGIRKLNSAWITNDDSYIVIIWDCFVVICALVATIFHPYFAIFTRFYPDWYNNISTAIHIIFILDLVVILTTVVYIDNKKIKTLTGILSYQLDRVGFTLDVVSAFYLEVYAPLTNNKSRYETIFKLNRLLKIYRFFNLFDKFERKQILNPVKVCCIKFMVTIFLFVYLNAHFLYATTCFFQSCSHNGWYIEKLKSSIETRIMSSTTNGQLLISFIYSLSVSLFIGIGDILPKNQTDLIVVMFGIISGKLVLGYYIAELISLITLKTNSSMKFQEHLSALNFHSKKRNVPKKLEKRIRNFFDVQWERDEAHFYLTNQPITIDVSSTLQREIKSKECRQNMNRFIIFNDLGDDFITYLMENARIITLGPSEIVTYFGSINREMYIICKGYCLQQTESNTYKNLSPGTAIGFSSLLFGLPSMNNTYTSTHCVLIYIDVTTFNNALRHTVGLYKIVYKARQRVLAKYNANYEVRMIENPHYTKMRGDFKMKNKKINEKFITNKSFINTYKYCIYNKESYVKLSNGPGKICFLKYLLMPIAILPNGLFIITWQIIRSINSLVTFICIPIEFALAPHQPNLYYFLLTTDIIAYIDTYIRMHLSYYDQLNQLVIHPWTTAEHYIKGSFILDVLIWFPYSGIIQGVARSHNEDHSVFSHSLSPHFLHCSVHLIKMFDFYKVVWGIKYLSERYQKCNIFHCCKYFFYSLLIIHVWSVILMVNTCEYKHISEIDENVTKFRGKIHLEIQDYNYFCNENSFINNSFYKDYTDVWQVYISSAYWTAQLMTLIGFGDIQTKTKRESLFVIFIIATGIVFYTYVLIDIVGKKVKHYTRLLLYESKFLRLINHLKNEKVNSAVTFNVIEHLQYYWRRTNGYEIYDLVSPLNSSLREDTMLCLYESTLRHVPLFENLDHAFFRVFGKELKEKYFMEGDIVLGSNDIVQDIHIIHKGAVEISGHHNMVPVIMGIGGIFGNVFDKNISLSGVVVRALKNLDTLCLNVEHFRRILKDYPVIQKKIGVFAQAEQRHYAIPSSFVDEGSTYVNPNLFWTAKTSTSVNSKNTLLTFCKQSISYRSLLFNFFTVFVLATAYYNCIITTYQFSFQHFSTHLLITTVFIDIIFLLKFCLEINYPYSPDGNANRCFFTKWTKILDFITNLPFSYSILFVPFVSNTSSHFYFSALRLITLLRMMYIFQFFKYYRHKLMYNRFLLELCNLVVLSTLIIHLLTCVWYMMVCPFKKCNDDDFMPSINKNNSQDLYAAALYLTVDVLSSTGTGSILSQSYKQLIIAIIFMIISKILIGMLIGQLINVFQSKNLSLVNFELMVREIHNYYVHTSIKPKKINYITDYLKLLWKKNHGLQDYHNIISVLPRSIQMELTESIYGSLLKDSYIFSQTERDFIRQMSLHLSHRTFFPGNYVVRDGDVDNTMYFIHRGDY